VRLYSVELSQRAQKFLDKLDKHLSERIKERLKRLAENPIPSDAKFIEREDNEKIFRYRIGDYRALYLVKETEKIVLIAKIDKRPRIYDSP
jgi:mRNA interferase RelE/StbE